MTSLDVPHPANVADTTWETVMFIITLLRGIAAFFKAMETRQQLSAMDGRMLSDIGLTRNDIEEVASGRLTRPRMN